MPTHIRPHTVYPEARARAMAAEMQAYDDSGWTYVAEIINEERGLAVLAVYDEDGVLAGYYAC